MKETGVKCIAVYLILLASYSSYAQRYWIAVATANWNNTANWSTASGGAGGASVPGSSDVVIFDGAGGRNGSCTIDMVPTVAGLSVSGYTGSIDLNGNNVTISSTVNNTFSSGTITNSSATPATLAITTSGIATFSGTTFGVSTSFAPAVNCSAAQVLLHGSTFYGTTTIAKTGANNNLGNGGNVFHGVTTLSNSGSAYFATGFTSADTFNGDLTLTNTGSSFVAVADNTAGNMFNGNIIVNCNAGVGVVFGNGPGSTMSSTLASGKTITVGGTGFSAGKLQLKSLIQSGTTAQNITLTGTATLQIGPSSTFNGAVTFAAPQILLNGCTYNNTASITKNGTSNNLGTGGNTFNGTTTLANSSNAYFATGFNNPDIFNADLTLTNTGAGGWIAMADNAAGNMFNGNIIVNSTNATGSAGVTFGNGPGTAVTATLATGKTITVGGTGFTAGRLLLRRFTQSGTTAQSFTLTGTSIAYIGPYSTFNGDVNFTSPQVYLNGCTYNGAATITKNGVTTNNCDGGNVFNGTTSLTNSSTATWLLANTTGDTFNGAVTFSKNSSGALQPASNGTSAFYGDITINSSSVVTFGSGTGVVQFAGNNDQAFTSASSVPVIQRLTMSKTSGTNTVTLNNPVDIGVTATLTNGVINTTSTNYLNFIAGSSYTGGSNSSYINGPVQKTGNTAFTFPTGNSSVYRTISISAPANATDAFTAQYFKAGQSYGGVSTYDPSFVTLSGCEYWILDRTTGSSNVNVTLSWNTADCTGAYITDPSTLRVARWNGTSWVNHGNGGTTGNASNGTVITSAVVTSFSPFTLASTSLANPLPVELISFYASVTNEETVELHWATASELNSDYFEIEGSNDGRSFLSIGNVKAAGNSLNVRNYSFEYPAPFSGVYYYRLRQVDFDGTASYSSTVKVEIVKQRGVAIYPNPIADRKINLVMSDNPANTQVVVKLLDNQQRELYSKEVDSPEETIMINIPDSIAAGTYVLKIAGHTGIYHKRVIIK